jgi:WD40 repeat protein
VDGPRFVPQVLNDHTEEVWHIQFSNNGRWLASASKDATAIIWEATARGLEKRHTLRGHTQALTFCCWRPDDSLLATCSMDSLVKIWDTKSGTCVRTILHHRGPTFTAAWTPDGAPSDLWLGLCLGDPNVSSR